MTETPKAPSVLFVCSKNGGKSQLAAGLMNQLAAGAVTVHSAGTEAKLEPREGTRFEFWETDEPSLRGIEGMERMRLVRDDIRSRVQALHAELTGN